MCTSDSRRILRLTKQCRLINKVCMKTNLIVLFMSLQPPGYHYYRKRFCIRAESIFTCGWPARMREIVCKDHHLCMRPSQPHAKIDLRMRSLKTAACENRSSHAVHIRSRMRRYIFPCGRPKKTACEDLFSHAGVLSRPHAKFNFRIAKIIFILAFW